MKFPKNEPLVLSIGGSLIVPNGGPDVTFLKALRKFVLAQVKNGRRLVLVTGGGKTARHYIDAADRVRNNNIDPEDLDWLGIHSSRLNGHLVRTMFREIAHPVVVNNSPKVPRRWKGKVLVAAGWKPGRSTDYVSARIGKRLGVKSLINCSNIDYVYDVDPRKSKNAKPLPEVSWKEYRKMVGDKWHPGKSAPFDPVASKFCQRHKMDVAIVNGEDFSNISKLIAGRTFKGTVLS